MDQDTTDYKTIMVIGADKVGKTKICSSLVTGPQHPQDYVPTRHCEVFTDVIRQFHLIDNPGVPDRVLNKNWFKFKTDPVIQDLVASSSRSTSLPHAKMNLYNIDAYIIVYSDCLRSQEMAKAMRLFLVGHLKHFCIYIWFTISAVVFGRSRWNPPS